MSNISSRPAEPTRRVRVIFVGVIGAALLGALALAALFLQNSAESRTHDAARYLVGRYTENEDEFDGRNIREFDVIEAHKSAIRFRLRVVGAAVGGGSVERGNLVQTAALNGTKAIYTAGGCTINMAFSDGKVAIKQVGACGFDAEGIATGSYQRVDSAGDSVTHPSSSNDKYVESVRRSVLDAPYHTTTIGKAFEATFTQPVWKSAESDKGIRYVEFTGRLKPEMYKPSFDSDDYGCKSAPRREAMRQMDCADRNEVQEYAELRRKGLSVVGERRPCSESELARLPDLLSADRCPTEEAYSTVKFQFVFGADGKTFRLEYFDPKPWEHTTINSYKSSSETKHCTTFSDGSCNAQWTTTQGTYSVALEDVLSYIYK